MEAVGSDTGACSYDCILSRFYSPTPDNGTKCMPCTPPSSCESNQRYVQCTRREDAECVACPNANLIASLNREFFVALGSLPQCDTQCKAGFALNVNTEQCVQCKSLCDGQLGMRPANDCETSEQRTALPECIPCDDEATQMPPNAHYLDRCVWECNTGYFLYRVASEPPECRPCKVCHVPIILTPHFLFSDDTIHTFGNRNANSGSIQPP